MEEKEKAEQTSVKDRLKLFIKHVNMSQSDFEKTTGLSNGYINNMRKSISPEKYDDTIGSLFPGLNKLWILHGVGNMMTTSNEYPTMVHEGKSKYNNLKPGAVTGYYFPNVSASAGLEIEMNNDELTKLPVTIPGWGDDISFINVYGDSMYPKYNAGEIIGVKAVEFDYLNYGYPYVIVLKNGDVYIKIVQPGSDKNHLSLESTNQFYPPKEFHLKNIKSFYSIKGVIKKEMI